MMQRIASFLAVITALFAVPSLAALEPGPDAAPDFNAPARSAATFHVSARRGVEEGSGRPVLLPCRLHDRCTIEAHGASAIGVSHDDLDTLNIFSVSECGSKFAVAADMVQSVMKSYDAVLAIEPEYADRVSYVIAPDGHVASPSARVVLCGLEGDRYRLARPVMSKGNRALC